MYRKIFKSIKKLLFYLRMKAKEPQVQALLETFIIISFTKLVEALLARLLS